MEAMATATIPAGRLLRPDDVGYEEARQVWNGMISHRPSVVARVESTEEVVAAVALARAEGLPISIRGGGHNVAGLAVGDGSLVVDLAAMSTVSVDPDARRARVGGGARWGDLDAAAQAHGLATPGGVVSDTGVAGLTLSGGLGWLRRKHGLSCDALRAATVVTADGRVVRASVDEHPDLFWGLRGGGGNFGVVTEFEFELFPLGPTVATTVAIWPIGEAAAVLREFRGLAPTMPDEVSPVAVLSPVPDDEAFPASIRGGDGLFILAVAAVPVEDGAPLLGPIAALGKGAAIDIGGPASYAEFQQFFDEEYPAHTKRYYWKSLVRGRPRRRPHRPPRRGVRAAAVAPFHDRYLGQRRRDRPRLARGQRVRPAHRAVARQPRVELGVGGRRRGEPRVGAGHRRRGRRHRLPELPWPPRGRRRPGPIEPRRDVRPACRGQAGLGSGQRVPLQRQHQAGVGGLDGKRSRQPVCARRTTSATRTTAPTATASARRPAKAPANRAIGRVASAAAA